MIIAEIGLDTAQPDVQAHWTLWASIQDGCSQQDFDFWSWGMEKCERAVAECEGPEFERLLREVQLAD